uniref:Insulin-like growth factor-binding protein complex acid labile subunit n=1 Tax=Lygus hesperus TaxID=30085 RepID=A0A146MA62_LYGHE
MCFSVWLFLAFFARASADICSVIHYSANKWDADCADKNLTVLPDFSDKPVVVLDLRNTSLTSNITFKGWNHLKYVDLSFNNLYDLRSDTFGGIDELETLNVSYCSLQNISGLQDKGKTLIKLLDLSGNNRLPPTPDFLPTLNTSLARGTQSLYINDMRITNFPPQFFISAVSLLRLHMRDNLLLELPIFPLNLRSLDISNNSIAVLHDNPFKMCTNLVTLVVQNSPELIEVDVDAFKYLLNLTVLSLKGNRKLDHLPNGVFSHNDNLREVSLAECNFKTLSPYFEPKFLGLKQVELYGNPWECNPSIQWFLALNSSSTALSSVRCENGLPYVQYFGHVKQTLMRNVMILLVVMTLSFFVIGGWYIYDLEKRRRTANPYWRLGRKNPMTDPVYISTIV